MIVNPLGKIVEYLFALLYFLQCLFAQWGLYSVSLLNFFEPSFQFFQLFFIFFHLSKNKVLAPDFIFYLFEKRLTLLDNLYVFFIPGRSKRLQYALFLMFDGNCSDHNESQPFVFLNTLSKFLKLPDSFHSMRDDPNVLQINRPHFFQLPPDIDSCFRRVGRQAIRKKYPFHLSTCSRAEKSLERQE